MTTTDNLVEIRNVRFAYGERPLLTDITLDIPRGKVVGMETKGHTQVIKSKVPMAEVLKYVDLPMPTPGPGEVLVKTEAIGVCKADWRVRTGRSQWLTCQFPVTIGYEMAGTIATPSSITASIAGRLPRWA